MHVTSSSAVAKRPRDASCLSVVSFNSTKRSVESFIKPQLATARRRLHASMMSICLSVCLSVCRKNAKTWFSQKQAI